MTVQVFPLLVSRGKRQQQPPTAAAADREHEAV